jgi:uncharacterized membrane protein YhhN
MMIAATAACAVACLALVTAEYRGWPRARIATKLVASLAFIVVGTLATTTCGTPSAAWKTYQMSIVIGLVLGALGDAALLHSSKRAFLAGLVAFLFGHIAYVLACTLLMPASAWLGAVGLVASAPILVGLLVLAWLWPRLGDMRVPVLFYLVTIVTMVIGALAALNVETVPANNRQLLALGAVLFFASDLAVARDKFVSRSVTNRAWGLPCYYAGQLLIAWSIGCP